MEKETLGIRLPLGESAFDFNGSYT
jgi:hypothetical protein